MRTDVHGLIDKVRHRDSEYINDVIPKMLHGQNYNTLQIEFRFCRRFIYLKHYFSSSIKRRTAKPHCLACLVLSSLFDE